VEEVNETRKSRCFGAKDRKISCWDLADFFWAKKARYVSDAQWNPGFRRDCLRFQEETKFVTPPTGRRNRRPVHSRQAGKSIGEPWKKSVLWRSYRHNRPDSRPGNGPFKQVQARISARRGRGLSCAPGRSLRSIAATRSTSRWAAVRNQRRKPGCVGLRSIRAEQSPKARELNAT